MKNLIKLADRSDNPMHYTPVDELKRALEFAEKNPEYNKTYIVLAHVDIVPGENDKITTQVFLANINELECAGLLHIVNQHTKVV